MATTTTTTTPFIAEMRSKLETRLQEIEPQAAELTKEMTALRATLSTLDDQSVMPQRADTKSMETRSSSGTKRRTKRRTGAGKRSATGERAQQALDTIKASEHPLKVREIADQMGLDKPNYLYRVLPALQQEGKVQHNDAGEWFIIS